MFSLFCKNSTGHIVYAVLTYDARGGSSGSLQSRKAMCARLEIRGASPLEHARSWLWGP